jgi:hypothetical protein
MYILFKTILTLEYFGADLTSGQDFVMINAIVTKLSQLPHATLRIAILLFICNSRKITMIIVFIIQIAPLLSLLQHQYNICKWTINRHYEDLNTISMENSKITRHP